MMAWGRAWTQGRAASLAIEKGRAQETVVVVEESLETHRNAAATATEKASVAATAFHSRQMSGGRPIFIIRFTLRRHIF